jgi:predicted NUDIX family NTP pyrophosphohydrolase
MANQSAGVLLYRRRGADVEVLLAHPGGPFWARKDQGAWSIPKGEFDDSEEPLAAARREFQEETGFALDGAFLALAPRRQKSGKIIHAFALERDLDPSAARSNFFTMEWPRGSGQTVEFPEVDRVAWFPLHEARRRIQPGQRAFLDELSDRLGLQGR